MSDGACGSIGLVPVIPGQAEAITEMARPIFDEVYAATPKDVVDEFFQLTQTPERIREQIASGTEYFFIMYDGERAGYLAYHPDDLGMYLSKLYLKKEFRGKGIGAKMLEHVEGIARGSGAACVHLEVNVLRTTAQEFYRSHGYEVKEQLEYYRVIMQKRL